ncbi:MAG: hypothetical protein ACTS7E_05075 [Arsenophonus sp. NC-CH8-MAG3]
MAFYNVSRQRVWHHKTTNPIESTFATLEGYESNARSTVVLENNPFNGI